LTYYFHHLRIENSEVVMLLIPELGVDHSHNLTKIMLNSIPMRKLFLYHVLCDTMHLFERSEVTLTCLVN
jgi:hypothetical protein